jgi:elongation factor Ts
MAITTAHVKELREKTGAGILDCKSALTETAGDMAEAEKLLRKKGLAAAAKKAGRTASEGLIGYKVTPERAALIELNSETDFVAKTERFIAARSALAELVWETEELGNTADGDVEKVKTLAAPGGAGTVADFVQALTVDTGENTQLRRFARLVAAPGNSLTLYAHPGDKTVVVIETTGCDAELGRDLAMHVAALAPQFATRESVSQKALEDEREIARAKAVAAGKPENVIDKMVEGMVGKWYGETVLLDQPFAKDDTKKVSQVIAERAGKDATVVRFVRYKVGEGIEKKATDFAAEVAAMAQ